MARTGASEVRGGRISSRSTRNRVPTPLFIALVSGVWLLGDKTLAQPRLFDRDSTLLDESLVESPRIVYPSGAIDPELLIQTRLTASWEDNALAPASREADIGLRRLRPGLTARFWEDRITVGGRVDLAPSTLELIDLTLEAKLSDEVILTAGQWKMPFTLLRSQSNAHLLLVDWPSVTRAFGSERQLGVEVEYISANSPWQMNLALGTGENRRRSHSWELPELYGELEPSASDMQNFRAPDRIAPEVFLRIGYIGEDLVPATSSDLLRTGPRYAVLLSAAVDTKPDPVQDLRFRIAPEAIVKAYGFSAHLVGYFGLFDKTQTDAVFAPGMAGALLELAYNFGLGLEVSGRFAYTHILDALRDDALAYRSAVFDEPEGTLSAGTRQYRQEYALGFNVYVLGDRVKLQVDQSYLRERRVDLLLHDLRFRAQLQWLL